jgi:hypothetical protein
MDPESVFTLLKIVGGIGGVLVLGSSLWALYVRRDRRYREEYQRFLEQKKRVDEHISATKQRLSGEPDAS